MKTSYTTLYKWMLVLSVLWTIGLTGCKDDFLNTVPQTSVIEKDAFNTPGKILAQVNNLYRQLQNPTFYGGRYIIFNEQRADEFGQNDGNAATGSAVWNQNVASTNDFVNNVWSAAYSAINASNILMDELSRTTVISDSLRQLYTGEAKFVRALSYLSLVQTYAKPYVLDKNALGVPLRLSAITTAGNNDLARSTVAEVYTQILKDLDEAEASLPVAYSSAILNTSRAHKSTAIALKSRVYLIQGDYMNVMGEASKLVSASKPFQYTAGSLTHKLEPSITAVFSGSYTGPEVILSIPFINSTTETPPTQSALAFNYVSQPIIFLTKDGIASDPALNSPEDARSLLIGTNSAKQKVLRKFLVTTAPFRDYVPVIRYAEVLLNYAEAAANQNDLPKAASLLQAVRNRSNANFVFPDAEMNTKEALLNRILTERRIELLGEGFRLGDLQRRGQSLPAKVGSIGTAPQVTPTAGNYIWPIPSGELSANKLIVPNP
ncbi:RagB/SusD family nutrient uptake outer membrane protein [Rhodocytophaga rosea]|uniref:RagB/SusD family nutrient uptake outer membrane protein n=1 Tax=Rhodocytophaga rosea TaxID=2704465 RepID=A0A6C0GUK2_9BACT|nr:RagB/SusD family nutrient uptake outer membrane protein [Rhodocytophaga rosea]QHT71484.1 RagB/SusD family nutrient uptake outer membrane protein [Rhodocytophaga rosea]